MAFVSFLVRDWVFGSLASGVARDTRSVMEVEDALLDLGFDTGVMFRFPNGGVIRAHRDSANLMEEEEIGVNDVMAIIWNSMDA